MISFGHFYLNFERGITILFDNFVFVAPIVVDSNSVIGMNGTSVDIHGVRLNVTYKHHIDTTTTLAFVTQRTESNTTGAHNVLEVKIQSVAKTTHFLYRRR